MKPATEFNSILDFIKKYPSEKVCIQRFKESRWRDGLKCPHCLHDKVYIYSDKKRYKCQACLKQFTDKVGTAFENSKISIQKWFIAIYLNTANKKGISSVQLAKYINVTQKTAWFMLHRIREVITEKSGELLEGTIEVDETFVGGKSKNKHYKKRSRQKISAWGSMKSDKIIVFGMLQRDGRIKTIAVPDRKSDTLKPIIYANVESRSTIMSDELHSYNGLNAFYDHCTVDHGAYQYKKDDIYTNSLEGAWSHLKRTIIGVYHVVSRKHMNRYCSEFDFRYNTRNYTDSERFYLALTGMEGRLKYKDLVA